MIIETKKTRIFGLLQKQIVRQLSLFSLLTLAASALAQQPTITPNYKDADIRKIVEAVGAVTGKNFILDPRVNAKVTMLSSSEMSPDAFYEAFLSILEVHGYVAITTGDIIKILPDASARQYPGYVSTSGAGADDIVTQVIKVENVGAAQLVPILRPLIPQYGHLAAHNGSNMLIISDRAHNVDRMITIIRRIDQSNDEDIEVVPLEHASAAEVVRVLTALSQTPRADGVPVTTSLVSDARTNSVLIGGDRSERLRLRALIAHLDTPLQDGGDTQVRYLRYADAEELATKLQQHFTQQAAGAAGPTPGNSDNVSVWADTQTNAIVVNAPPKMMRSLMNIVDKLDIRRAQVLVEAIIVEVIADKSSELGVTWAVDGSGDKAVVGVTNFPPSPGVVQLAGALSGGSDTIPDPGSLIGTGVTFGVGRIADTGTNFAAILRALRGDADTNIISTPTIVTTDNEEASLNVGQEVPFVTGSFSNTGTGGGGAVNPFQTVQRQQVGVKLVITPQINEGDSLLLKISQEISSIASSSQGAVDLITNQRIIETTVIVEDGAILVLGGLLEDTLRESDQRVPILGSIPVLGALFRSRTTNKVKTNLMVFIRPKILRDDAQMAFETNAKYNYIRDVQQEGRSGRVALMPGEDRLVLPPLEAQQKPAGPVIDLRRPADTDSSTEDEQ
ncbi:MAG: type II secretion system secretin GspD [Gammaproteobacteria bacterium]|nr:type II secretion system secretin GspD [Gammaproteobacteria bacterium]MDH4315453.1 type II secretion system secretin GspD [Gammaproteobacteria bacterium]MDH5214218.1 type II secretion system secretin GspD [Gammaproteobacteria bacterium]MDH5501557.1 type II secretion system secretin GspD [Gammaproteobacteria bacterium]